MPAQNSPDRHWGGAGTAGRSASSGAARLAHQREQTRREHGRDHHGPPRRRVRAGAVNDEAEERRPDEDADVVDGRRDAGGGPGGGRAGGLGGQGAEEAAPAHSAHAEHHQRRPEQPRPPGADEREDRAGHTGQAGERQQRRLAAPPQPVSYTHLTLPTIYSV